MILKYKQDGNLIAGEWITDSSSLLTIDLQKIRLPLDLLSVRQRTNTRVD